MNPSKSAEPAPPEPGGVLSVPGIFPIDRAEAELRESRRALATLMENLPGMAYRCLNDPDWTMQVVSQGALALTGLSPAELIGNNRVSYGQLIHPEDRDRVYEEVQGALETGTRFRIVYRIITVDGVEKWVWEQGCGIFDDSGDLSAIEGFITDITEARKAEEQRRELLLEQAARHAAEMSERRARFVAEGARILAASFDYHTALASLARLFVPVVADLCTVDVLTPDGELLRAGAAHIDPEIQLLLQDAPPVSASRLPEDHPIAAALLRGKSTFLPEMASRDAGAWGEAEFPSATARTPRSLLVVPLLLSESVLGVLSLGTVASDRRFNTDDLALAEELARGAALAVENARLFHQAQQATRARDQVLAVVAHDLRNPLNTVSLASQVLLRSPFEDHHRKHLETIRKTADRMAHMIQDLLEVAHIESGQLSIARGLEAVESLIAEAVTMYEPLAAGQSIRLETELEVDLPLVVCDSARVLQVLSNLIGNAVKFTPPDGLISLHCVGLGAEVRFGVSDSGPGIPTEQLPHVFRRFWQADPGDRRGIGLGLPIAEGIVVAHGGRIWVESATGSGTTFYFTLPAEERTAQPLE